MCGWRSTGCTRRKTQVKVAQEGLELADNELAQARRRYEAGVANSLEVTDAQTRLERARDNQTAGAVQLQPGAHRPGAGHGQWHAGEAFA